jgi:hypothetical protein
MVSRRTAILLDLKINICTTPFMANQSSDLTRFNKRMDELVENVVSTNLISPEFRREYVKATSLLRRVAQYDTQLAYDLYVSIAMFSYAFGIGVIEKSKS